MLNTRSAAVATALAQCNPHARDARITFDEPAHLYFIDGIQVGVSVTGVLKSVEPDPFDAPVVAARIAKARNVRPRYLRPDGTRMSVQEICDSWESANKLGTDLHATIERYLNGVNVDAVAADPKHPNYQPFHQFLVWLQAFRARGYEPYRTEWIIFDALSDVAGSIDCVFRNVATGGVFIVDWKRCLTWESSGFAEAYGGKTLLPPLSHVPATKLNEWQLQVNIYRDILTRLYGLRVEGMAMVVLHPDNSAAEQYFHAVNDDDVRVLLNARRETLGPWTDFMGNRHKKRPRLTRMRDAKMKWAFACYRCCCSA